MYEFESLRGSDQTVAIGFFRDMESGPAKAYKHLMEKVLESGLKWGRIG